MRHSATARTTSLPTSLRGPSINAAAACGARIREVGVFNTAATEVRIGLMRCTGGTQSGTVTKAPWDLNQSDPLCTVGATHSADVTAGAIFRLAVLGAAIGSGVIWTFGDNGIIIPEGTTNGIVIFLPGGTGQQLDFYFDWDE